jgi:hypothetical protein
MAYAGEMVDIEFPAHVGEVHRLHGFAGTGHSRDSQSRGTDPSHGKNRGVRHLAIGRDISRHDEVPPTYSRATGGVDLVLVNGALITGVGQ